jgi:hypothetical protein
MQTVHLPPGHGVGTDHANNCCLTLLRSPIRLTTPKRLSLYLTDADRTESRCLSPPTSSCSRARHSGEVRVQCDDAAVIMATEAEPWI